jgi:endonuclease/exonuclease/phosphatase family metal-dependent hydrolase
MLFKILFFNVAFLEFGEKEVLEFLEKYKKEVDFFALQEVSVACREKINQVLEEYNIYSSDKKISDSLYFALGNWSRQKYQNLENFDIFASQPNLPQAIHTCINTQSIKKEESGFSNLPNQKLNIINFHGNPLPGNKLDNEDRLLSSKIIKNYIQKLSGKIIFGGDFNLLPEARSLKTFEEMGLVNLITKYNIQTTRNENAWRKYPDSKQYFCDYIFISKKIEVVKFEVIQNDISDHLPMLLEINL